MVQSHRQQAKRHISFNHSKQEPFFRCVHTPRCEIRISALLQQLPFDSLKKKNATSKLVTHSSTNGFFGRNSNRYNWRGQVYFLALWRILWYANLLLRRLIFVIVLIVDLFKDSNLFLLVSSLLILIFRGTDWLDFSCFFFFLIGLKFSFIMWYYITKEHWENFTGLSPTRVVFTLEKYRIANVAFMCT